MIIYAAMYIPVFSMECWSVLLAFKTSDIHSIASIPIILSIKFSCSCLPDEL